MDLPEGRRNRRSGLHPDPGQGVLATGTVNSVPKPAPQSWGFPGRYCAEIASVEFLASPISMFLLIRRFPNWKYPTYPRSYATVRSPLAEEILGFIGHCELAIVDEPLSSSTLSEGTPRTINIVQYERSKKARHRCLARWGCRCAVCGIAFGEFYGPEFSNYIHVHHLEPISSRKTAFRLNPEVDLRPICPNCHAVAHRSDPPFSIAEIKKFIREAQRSDN